MGVLGPGDFIGSALILSGLKPDFDAVADEPVRVVRWPIQALEKYLDAKPEMRIVMQRHLARELSGKVRQLVDGP
jgi:CRP-like cAMP-binding protein